jgi:hypothetical protein
VEHDTGTVVSDVINFRSGKGFEKTRRMNIGDGNDNLNGDTGLASRTALLGSDRRTDVEQQFQTEGVPMHSGPKPSDVVSHSQRVSFQLTRQAIRWCEYCCLRRHSRLGSHYHYPAATSSRTAPPSEGPYSPTQLILLKKPSDSHIDGSVIAAVAKSMLTKERDT